MRLIKTILFSSIALFVSTNIFAQDFSTKADIYNENKVLIFNEVGAPVGYYLNSAIPTNTVRSYDLNGNYIGEITLDNNNKEPNIWLDEKTKVPYKPNKRLELEEKVM